MLAGTQAPGRAKTMLFHYLSGVKLMIQAEKYLLLINHGEESRPTEEWCLLGCYAVWFL
jgi:hypothetical protein